MRTRREVHFSDGLTLLGADLDADAPPAFTVKMLWGTEATPPSEDIAVALLLGPDGRQWSPAGTGRPRGYEPPPPTTMWQPGQYAYDPQIVTPLPGTPPGTYTVAVSLFDRHTLKPASVLGADGNPQAPRYDLGTVTLTRPVTSATLAELSVPPTATLRTCGPLGLWHVRADRATAAPGDLIALHWVWESLAPSPHPLSVTVRLGDKTYLRPPSAPWWPTNRWQAGDRWIGQPVIAVPGGLPSGEYHITLTLPHCPPLAELPLRVVAPTRHWTVSDSFTPLDVPFGTQIRLAGYEITPTEATAGDAIRISLAWQAQAEMNHSYRVFVHLLASDGHLVAQDDGIPAGWTRPTTGWAVGEVITETRTLRLPPELARGGYEVQVGLYLPDGPRLVLPTGEDAYQLAEVQVK